MRCNFLFRFVTLSTASFVSIVSAQVPTTQLLKPPANARRLVVISAAGRHGTSAIWKGDDGSDLFRESILLRGMVTELDEAIHIGPNGQPDRIVIRGTTPSGDSQENFSVNDREARWKSPVDSGAAAYDNRAYYVPYGGTMSSIAVLAEKLLTAPGRKLPLLPKGEARLERLVSISIGEGSAQQTLTAY